MLPESEINDLLAQLERMNSLIAQQESRIEFMQDSGQDVTAFVRNLEAAKQKRDMFTRALEKQVSKYKPQPGSSSSRKSG